MDNFTGGVDDVWGNSGADMGNGLSDINPEDIEERCSRKYPYVETGYSG